MSEEIVLDNEILAALEAILMVVDEPVPTFDLADTLGVDEAVIEQALAYLLTEYAGRIPEGGSRQRGFELRYVAGGWRFYSRPEYAPFVGKYVVGTEQAQLTQAALETLAIVAYRQPVTRGQVAHVRGVNVDSVMRKLQARGLIEEVGTTPTGANLYETTPYFLECMGFETLDQLVPLAPFLPPAEEIEALTIEIEE